MGSPPTGPAAPGRLPIDFRPRRSILLPYNDLLIDAGLDQFLPIDPKGFALTLGMVYGLGPNEPRVLRTDDGGSLLVSMAGQAVPGSVRLQDGAGALLSSIVTLGDQPLPTAGVATFGTVALWDGTNTKVARSASAANLAAQSGLGAALVAPPGEWPLVATPAGGAQATATKAAGAAGVRHILRSLSFSAAAAVAPAAQFLNLFVRDGLTGAGAIIWAAVVLIPAAIGQSVPPVVLSGLNIVGSAATAMTVETSGAVANVTQVVSASGYDAA